MSKLHDIIRAKHAAARENLLRQLREIREKPRDIEAEIRCMWKMILDEEPGYGMCRL